VAVVVAVALLQGRLLVLHWCGTIGPAASTTNRRLRAYLLAVGAALELRGVDGWRLDVAR